MIQCGTYHVFINEVGKDEPSQGQRCVCGKFVFGEIENNVDDDEGVDVDSKGH